MARALRGKPPEEIVPGKPKVIVYGAPGVGKTWAAIDFPNVYIIDVEGGATQPQYVRKLKQSGGLYMGKADGSQDYRTVIDEVKHLATSKHDRQTLILDSFSKIYLDFAAQEETRVGSDFGKDKKEANKPTRQLMMWLERVDMNVILICHTKDKWVRGKGKDLVNEGATFDGWDKMGYDLDLSIEVTPQTRYPSLATVIKSRLEGFPRGTTFPWEYKTFAGMAGEATMLREAKQFVVATAEQVEKVRHLVNILKSDQAWIDRIFLAAGVQDWSEMEGVKIAATIKLLQDKIDKPAKPTADGDAKE